MVQIKSTLALFVDNYCGYLLLLLLSTLIVLADTILMWLPLRNILLSIAGKHSMA